MVRRIIADNPNIDRNELTLLSEELTASGTSLTVQNTSNFTVNDLILIGNPQTETAEVRKIATIPDSETITVTSPVSFKHEQDEPLIKLDFNELKIYRSTDGGSTFPLLATISLDYNSPQNTTEYVDTAGTQPYIYRFAYFNSETSVEDAVSGDIKQTALLGYITVEEFKAQTGIKVHDSLIEEAITIGATILRRELYTPREYRTGNSKTEHFLPVHHRLTFADTDLSNSTIDKNDFYAYEEDPATNGVPGTRTDVTSDITTVDVDRQTLTFGTSRPTSNKTLVVIWHETWEKLKFDTNQATVAGLTGFNNITLKRLNKLWAVNYVFENVPFHKLQRGISSWSLGGVNVPFDYDAMQKVMEDNNKRIRQILTDLEVPYTKYTTLQRPKGPILKEFLSTLQFRKLSY